jgi:Fe-S cluster assembly ATP-binding protein
MKLRIENLHASVDNTPILRGVNLTLNSGEVHALMGPNGSGKSTLANVLMGHPAYEITGGSIYLDSTNILQLSTSERAQAGLFLAFQYPSEIPGVTVGKFLKRALEALAPANTRFNVTRYIADLRQNVDYLEMDRNFINRYLNEGFSGGEKKRMEILQMLMLNPAFAILDETDSGLDIDALKVVAKGVNHLRSNRFGSLIITHYQRILNYINPDKVHILYQGKVVTSGGVELVQTLEQQGYDWVRKQFGTVEESHEYATTDN